jgi:hypothetical protein
VTTGPLHQVATKAHRCWMLSPASLPLAVLPCCNFMSPVCIVLSLHHNPMAACPLALGPPPLPLPPPLPPGGAHAQPGWRGGGQLPLQPGGAGPQPLLPGPSWPRWRRAGAGGGGLQGAAGPAGRAAAGEAGPCLVWGQGRPPWKDGGGCVATRRCGLVECACPL